MSGVDLDKLVEPVSQTNPTGDDLSYTDDFQHMLDAAAGQPERVMGDSVIPAVDPDWRSAIALGIDLLSRSKDLRTAIVLCQALLATKGFPGLGAGLDLIRRLLTKYWEGIHPQLDADDNNDPTERINALLNLCDREAFLTPLRVAPLVSSRTFGIVRLRDVAFAKDELAESGGEDAQSLDAATIDAAFLDCEIDQLRETASAAESAASSIQGIDATVADRVGVEDASNLKPVLDVLSACAELLRARVIERTEREDGESSTSASEETPAGETATGTDPASSAKRSMIGVDSREDVVRMLDILCGYYARNEPSSPVPLLLQRARRLVTKDFMGIVQDLAPDALAQIEAIRGSENDS